MIDRIIEFSLRQRGFILLLALIWIGVGIWSATRLPIDAVPDITNIQVQINTTSPALAAEEIEKLITFPLESELAGLPDSTLIRSLSRYGFSQITIIFKDGTDIYRARQLVSERLQNIREELPPETEPRMAPITTGLGDIFFYTLAYTDVAPQKKLPPYQQLLELNLIQDYQIKPLLRSVPGVAEISSTGGYEKQIVISPHLKKLRTTGISFTELSEIIAANTENAGGSLLEIGGEQISIRTTSRVTSIEQLESLPITFTTGTTPILLKDIATVKVSSAIRTGAATENGHEAMLGGVLMLSGENSRAVSQSVAQKMKYIQKKLPEGVTIRTVYDRSDVVNATIKTVRNNLLEGAILVIAVLFLMLGNIRSAILVALAIPLSMLFALTGMLTTGVSGNLMSLGAIDFGLIVEGAVVMIENAMRRLNLKRNELNRTLTAPERNREVLTACREMGKPMVAGVLIITVVYFPILALTGIEGKMFKPMALTAIFALIASLILALTLIPVLASYFLTPSTTKKTKPKSTPTPLHEEENQTRLMRLLHRIYTPTLHFALSHRILVLTTTAILFIASLLLLPRLGAEFIPHLDEGSISIQMIRSNSAGLNASLELQKKSEKILLEKFPEITHTFSRIGTSEIATDPMPPNVADTYIFLKQKNHWRLIDGKPATKNQLIELMRTELTSLAPGQTFLFTQPIKLRFDEILAGSKADLSVKIFGDDYETLEKLADQIRAILETIPGAGDVEFEASGRNPLLQITPRRDQLQRLNLHGEDINRVVETALAGKEIGTLIDGNRRYPIVVRANETDRHNIPALKNLPLRTDQGGIVPLGLIAETEVIDAIGTINREATQRRLAVLVNLRGRDTESFVQQAETLIEKQITLPDGYYYEFGGQYENYRQARQRFMIILPISILLIFTLIFTAFTSIRQSLIIITGIPLAITGGIFALWLRDIPFSISAGIGFIALSGIATLDGIVLVTVFNEWRERGLSLMDSIIRGTRDRLRPVMMTSLVASLGFIPMAIATSAGAEVQRPLATVVIGGVLSEVFLTLIIVPILYLSLESKTNQSET